MMNRHQRRRDRKAQTTDGSESQYATKLLKALEILQAGFPDRAVTIIVSEINPAPGEDPKFQYGSTALRADVVHLFQTYLKRVTEEAESLARQRIENSHG
jgi:hypothetical protein